MIDYMPFVIFILAQKWHVLLFVFKILSARSVIVSCNNLHSMYKGDNIIFLSIRGCSNDFNGLPWVSINVAMKMCFKFFNIQI